MPFTTHRRRRGCVVVATALLLTACTSTATDDAGPSVAEPSTPESEQDGPAAPSATEEPEGPAADEPVLSRLGSAERTKECVTTRSAEMPAPPDEPPALADIDAALDRIASKVRLLRGIDGALPPTEVLPPAEATDDVLRRFDEAAVERNLEVVGRMLRALGAIEPDVDYEEFLRGLLVGAAGGYYVAEEGRLVVVDRGAAGLDELEASIVAHEVDHALVDTAVGLPDLDEPPFDVDSDAALAAGAVVEGDAELLQQQWHATALPTDRGELLRTGTLPRARFSGSDSLGPAHVMRELAFPYVEGLDLVCEAWLDGGWEAVDGLYDDLPATTAEVLFVGHPGVTRVPVLPEVPAGHEVVLEDTFGAAPLDWLLTAPGDSVMRGVARDAVSDWGGGLVRVAVDGDATVVHVALTDRTGAGDDGRFCAAVTSWADATNGATNVDTDIAVTCGPSDVLVEARAG